MVRSSDRTPSARRWRWFEDHTETPRLLPGSQSPRSPRSSDLFCSVERRSGDRRQGTVVFVHATRAVTERGLQKEARIADLEFRV